MASRVSWQPMKTYRNCHGLRSRGWALRTWKSLRTWESHITFHTSGSWISRLALTPREPHHALVPFTTFVAGNAIDPRKAEWPPLSRSSTWPK